jgi:hypothetical protein
MSMDQADDDAWYDEAEQHQHVETGHGFGSLDAGFKLSGFR